MTEIVDKKLLDNLKLYLKENNIAAYHLSGKVLNKSPSYLTIRLNTHSLSKKDFLKILNHLQINIENLNKI
ncbi:hypothetical protein ABID23_000956 [Bartonella silvatica]|uniref:Uncharacterized protein n=1 Tax=Bartonella silvatica TaxID=357760 RepID=A0ABV2HH35_9HYPH